jgi:hypothetical protein
MKMKYQSKLFRVGNILLALALAIRGIPKTWQPEQTPVTRDSGWAIYAPEIEILDRIDPKLHIFQSGVLAAALMTLAIDPAMVRFWEQVNQERWRRLRDGRIDAVGWLVREILRHSGNREVAVRPEYQHYLFQAALAAAMTWYQGLQTDQVVWVKGDPARVGLIRLLEQVRMGKGLGRSPEGFRPLYALKGRIPVLARTEIAHAFNWSLAESLAERAASVPEYAWDVGRLEAARAQLESVAFPLELAAPGALAAAMVSLARDPGRQATWCDVSVRRWSHDPDSGSDLSGLIVRTIEMHNRQSAGAESQAELFARILMAIKSDDRRSLIEFDPRSRNLPRARPCHVQQLLRAWRGLQVPDGPAIHTAQVQPVIKGDPTRSSRGACQKRRRQSRDRTGRLGEEIFERLHKRCSLPRAGSLIDRTREQCGYDHELLTASAPVWYFEVKVVKNGEFSLTEKQWEMAQEMGDRYWLVLVRLTSKSDGEVAFIRNPAAVFKPRKASRVVIEVSYKVSRRDWRKAAKRWISSEPNKPQGGKGAGKT